jgi:hypothetical protein
MVEIAGLAVVGMGLVMFFVVLELGSTTRKILKLLEKQAKERE